MDIICCKNRYEILLRLYHFIFLQQDFYWCSLLQFSNFIYRWFSISWPNHFPFAMVGFLYWPFLFFNFNHSKLTQPSEHTFYRAAFDLLCFCFHICDAMCARQILNLLELVTLTSTRNYLLFAMGHIFCQDFSFVSILILKVSPPSICYYFCACEIVWKLCCIEKSRPDDMHIYLFAILFSGHWYHSANVSLSRPIAEYVSESVAD